MSERTPDEILAYCEAATEGPWEIARGGGHKGATIDAATERRNHGRERDANGYGGFSYTKEVFQVGGDLRVPDVLNDCQFICNAREDLPRLAWRVKELEALCREAAERLRETETSYAMVTSSTFSPSTEELIERLRKAGGESGPTARRP